MTARDACLQDPVLLTLLVAGNLAIFLSYMAIPAALVRIALQLRKAPPFPILWALSAAFVLACGFTHAAAALVFFRPAWHLETAICLATAVISSTTACLFWARVNAIIAALREYGELAGEMEKARNAITR